MEAIARDVRVIFSGLRRHFDGLPPEPEETPFRAVADWFGTDPLVRGADMDTRHGRMSVIRFRKAVPPATAGEIAVMSRTEADYFASVGVVEMVCAEASAYNPYA